MYESRVAKSPEEKRKANSKDRNRKAATRAGQSPETKRKVNAQDRENKAKERTKISHKEGLKCQEILNGKYTVPDLNETADSIGTMSVICQYCNALKFKKETASTCCNNGKVILESFPQPPLEIDNSMEI